MGRARKKGNPEGAKEDRDSRLRAELQAAQETVNKIRKQLKLEPVSIPDEDALSCTLQQRISRCPHCLSESIDAGDYDGDKELTCVVTCADCGARWGERYDFVGAWWLHEPDEEGEPDPNESAEEQWGD